MLKRRAGVLRVVDSVRDRVRALAGQVSDLGIVPVDARARSPPEGRPSRRASARRCARARRSDRAGRGRGCRAAPRAGGRAARPPAAPLRRPRAVPGRRRARRGGWRRRRRRGSRRSGSRRAGGRARGSRPPWRSSWSCRSSRRRLRLRRAGAQPARRSLPDRASRAACPAASCRRRRRRSGRAWRPRAQPGIRRQGGRSSGREPTRRSGDENAAEADPSFEGTSRAVTRKGEETAHLRAYVLRGSTSWRGGFMRG